MLGAALRILPLLLFVSGIAPAQTQQEQVVIQTVQRLFDAMAARDAVAAGQVLMPGGSYVAVRQNGTATRSSHEEFLDRLPKGKEKLLERMWNPKVMLSDGVAVLWTEYDFHRDGKFSHCGVDAFNLVKTPEGWKIASFSYTVQTSGCRPRR